ncbi:MAG: sensor histidine kinase [Rectinemataceae bacterium]
MTLRTKMFVSFSALLLLSALVSLAVVFRTVDSAAKVPGGQAGASLLSSAVERFGSGPAKSAADAYARSVILELYRRSAQTSVASTNAVLDAVTWYIVYLFVELLILLVITAILVRTVTRPLAILLDGIRRVERRLGSFRLPPLQGSEFAHIGKEFNQLLDLLEENEDLLREQSRLLGWQEVASFLSHQLKNPLTSVMLAGKNLGMVEDEGQIRTNIAIIQEEGQRIVDLVNRFRSSTTFALPRMETAEISRPIANAAGRFAAENAIFEIDSGVAAPLNMDPQLMEEAFVNLFTNSVQASEDEAIRPVVIRVTVKFTGSSLIIDVSDSVTHVPLHIAERVLRTPFSTKPAGSGLGLVFVRSVITLHGGTIGVHGSVEGGLVFTIRLPLRGAS